MRVLFWGTPEFALPSLRALLGEGYDVVGVVTQPDRPQGRHHSHTVPSPVKQVALEEELPVLQPERPRGEAFLAAARALAPDISVVVAYGCLLPDDAIALPPRGTLNIHASLLPRWRGAAPIQAAIRAGDAETGVSIMRMIRALDAGPVLLRAPTPIADDETGGELALRLSELGALAIVEALTLVALDGSTETPQNDEGATYAPRLDRTTTRIDWSLPAEAVARTIRAFDPTPGAWSVLRKVDVKLFGARAIPSSTASPGTVRSVGEEGAVVTCGSGSVQVGYLQPAGKRRLAAADLATGRGIAADDRFLSA
jgi:methionyl-tRNA formyltransferase